MNNINLDDILKQVQAHEAKIQSSLGEKSAMKRQLIEEENELSQLRSELKDKFGFDLEDLESIVNEMAQQIEEEYLNLDEKVKKLE